MPSSETDALLPSRRRPNGPSWGATLSVGIIGLVSVASGARFGWKAYDNYRWKQLLGTWEERTSAQHTERTRCNSCAVVIPSDRLAGKGMGSAIDAHDCVVRFNTHDPADAPAEDWGSKDDIRVVNAYQVEALGPETGSCIDPQNPTCRRVIITWETPSVEGFMGDHANAELLPQMGAEYFPGAKDVHETLREFANQNGLGVPMFGSSAYCAVSIIRHPDICGERLTLFGIPSSMAVETTGYIDPHGPPSAAHCYETEHEFFRKTAGSAGWENVLVQDMGDAPVPEPTPVEEAPDEEAPQEEQPQFGTAAGGTARRGTVEYLKL